MEENSCPRCIEGYEDEDGTYQHGTHIPSDCDECGVCENCEHFIGCSKSN